MAFKFVLCLTTLFVSFVVQIVNGQETNATDTYPDDERIVFVETDMTTNSRDQVIYAFQSAYRSGLHGYEKVLYIRETLERQIGKRFNVFSASQQGFYYKFHYYPGNRAVVDHDGKYWVIFNL